MPRFTWLLVASFITILLSSQNSFAIGLGGFIDVSSGSGDARWESDYYSWDNDSMLLHLVSSLIQLQQTRKLSTIA